MPTSPAQYRLDQLLELATKKGLDPTVVTWLQRKMNEETVFQPRPVTLEALDRLIQMASDEVGYHGGTHADELCELLFGSDGSSGLLLDLSILARIALVHLRGASFLVHEEPTPPVQPDVSECSSTCAGPSSPNPSS